MAAHKSFDVFGNLVEVIVPSRATGNSFCVLIQTSQPGGGPPPHIHANEDEIFHVLEGDYELFDGENWNPIPQGQPVYGLRGKPHTFRNCGNTTGRIMAVATPGGLDEYLESISGLRVPDDLERLTRISDAVGIEFVRQQEPLLAAAD